MRTIPYILIVLSAIAFSEADDAIRTGITRALPIIEAGARGSAEERHCFTCHNQGLPIIVAVEAKRMGFEIDDENLETQLNHTAAHLKRGLSSYRNGTGQGGKADTAGMALWALGKAGHEPDEVTDAVVSFLLAWNRESPHWRPQSDRPPSEGSFFTSTFLALRGLKEFGSAERRPAITGRNETALAWLEDTDPEETEDAVFRLRALRLLEGGTANAGQQLLGLQREDGSWGQLPGMEGEAYSTGASLVALHEAKVLPSESDSFRKGIQFLLETQEEDGSWLVKSRSRPIQKYYESGFPHGKDQFISSSGTCWAVLALLKALPPGREAESEREIQ